jgi:hypothetical protein
VTPGDARPFLIVTSGAGYPLSERHIGRVGASLDHRADFRPGRGFEPAPHAVQGRQQLRVRVRPEGGSAALIRLRRKIAESGSPVRGGDDRTVKPPGTKRAAG